MAQTAFLTLGDRYGETPVTSFSWKPGSGPFAATDERGGAQMAQGDDLYLTRDSDSYSPILLQYSGSGNHIEKASLNVYRTFAGDSPRLTVSYIMGDAYISHYNSNGRSDAVGLNFVKLEIANWVYDAEGHPHKIGDPD